jgi:hypothetical protein
LSGCPCRENQDSAFISADSYGYRNAKEGGFRIAHESPSFCNKNVKRLIEAAIKYKFQLRLGGILNGEDEKHG